MSNETSPQSRTGVTFLNRVRARLRDDRGFNILEVLTVTVIVGAVLAIALAQYGNYKDRAHVTALKSDTRMIAQSFEMVYAEQNAYPTVVAPVITPEGAPAIELANGDLETYIPIYSVPVGMNTSITEVYLYPGGEDFRVTMMNTTNKSNRIAVWDSSTGGFTD